MAIILFIYLFNLQLVCYQFLHTHAFWSYTKNVWEWGWGDVGMGGVGWGAVFRWRQYFIDYELRVGFDF